MNKISIIIPAYNCETYIERCIKSLIEQEYENIEIIVVNDGSTDNTERTIKKLVELDKRIIYVYKENGGVSSARNAGINVASGDYVGFVDADDYVEPDMFSEMVKELGKSKSDIALIGYYQIAFRDKKKILFPWDDELKIFDKTEIANRLIPPMLAKLKTERSSIFGAVWRALIKKEIAKEIKFDENIAIAEDLLYLIDCLEESDSVIAINKCLYNYIKNDKSATNKYKPDYDKTNEYFRGEIQKRLKKINFFEKNSTRYGLYCFNTYTLTVSNIMKNTKSSFSQKKHEVRNKTNLLNNEKYINKNCLRELNWERKFIYLLTKLRAYSIITIMFKIKNKIQK